MSEKSDEEVSQDLIDKLGQEAGVFFRHLETHLYTVRDDWKIYVGLFGTNKERVDLLNLVAGPVISSIQKSLYETAILSICRLTDPKHGAKLGETNITVRRLLNYLLPINDGLLEKHVEDAVAKSKFARDYRNKRLAHADDNTINAPYLVSKGSRKDMRDAIDAIALCIKRFAHLKLNIQLVTHPISNPVGDHVKLLSTIYYGRQEVERIQKLAYDVAVSGNWQKAKTIEELPDWLIFRPEDEMDI